MHEYSVASEMIHALLPKAETIDGRIVAVILKKGEMRILSDQALANAFELLAQGTVLENARLVVELVSVRVSCPACGYEGAVDHVSDDAFHFAVPILSCPTCQSEVDMKAGRELYVDSLTVQTPSEAEQA
ncbi:hydrogenase maturation nickel metallochaperone HypA [Candidatus Bipolaricaulota bacterium]|nr:hydrogenase maturation nickel metallochaperone HypA [Candidatus Bipolaricaulota bacterium]TFH11417.1 MAG: hydrogenase maturation nickel metallochaperone HypA [Candidatus Atribacteria bacterium]